MTDPVTILADVREASAGVPAVLLRLGVEVEWSRLPAGDYIVPGGVAVERKSVSDFHDSIRSGRLWRQATMIKRAAPRGFMIVEGVNLDGGPLAADAVRGALLALIDQDLPVLRSSGPHDTALWLRRLAVRAARPPNAPRRRAYLRAATPAALLASIEGISRSTAAALLESFGSVAAVAAASEEDLRRIEGIGPVRAAAVRRILTECFWAPAGKRSPAARSVFETDPPEVPTSPARAGRNRITWEEILSAASFRT